MTVHKFRNLYIAFIIVCCVTLVLFFSKPFIKIGFRGDTDNEKSASSVNLVARLLIRDEGKRNKPYYDTRGNITIGVGRNLTGKGLSDAEVLYLLHNDLNDSEASLKAIFGLKWFMVGKVRQACLIDVIFNLGEPHFRTFHKFIEAVEKRDWQTASKELLDSTAAHENAKRYHRNAKVLRTGKQGDFEL